MPRMSQLWTDNGSSGGIYSAYTYAYRSLADDDVFIVALKCAACAVGHCANVLTRVEYDLRK
jgi:hypothetical protein